MPQVEPRRRREGRAIPANHDRQTSLGGPIVEPPDIADVRAAAERLRGVVVRTPLVPLHSFGASSDIYLKPEMLQPVGSYKLRGVYNWAASLNPELRERGLSTHSAGNTAQALGYVARLFGVSARSLVPDFAPYVKVRAVESYGATPVVMPFDELLDFVFAERWKHEPYNFLNPWGEPKMIAGSATIGLEIIEDSPDVETVYVPVGGGGLVAGMGSVLKALKPSVRIVGVQAEACPALHSSFAAGRPVWVDARPTICEGVAVPFVSDEMYPLLRSVIDDVVLVSEGEVRRAIRVLASNNSFVVEGAGALSVAAVLADEQRRGKTVCILSGGKIEMDELAAIVGQPVGKPGGEKRGAND
jgi:threonine dehydratase